MTTGHPSPRVAFAHIRSAPPFPPWVSWMAPGLCPDMMLGKSQVVSRFLPFGHISEGGLALLRSLGKSKSKGRRSCPIPTTMIPVSLQICGLFLAKSTENEGGGQQNHLQGFFPEALFLAGAPPWTQAFQLAFICQQHPTTR